MEIVNVDSDYKYFVVVLMFKYVLSGRTVI